MNKLIALVLFFLFCTGASALEFSDKEKNQSSNFKSLIEVSDLDIKVPTVIEVPLNNSLLTRAEFAVFEQRSDSFQPFYFIRNSLSNEVPSVAFSKQNSCKKILDDDYKTYCEYKVPESGFGFVEISVEGEKEFSSSQLNLQLDRYVALPLQIEVLADGKQVYKKDRMQKSTIFFPATKAKTWTINLSYNQLLRISEINFVQNEAKKYNHSIRFLARPNTNYKIYLNPDTFADINIDTGESANLRSNIDIKKTRTFSMSSNPNFVESDIDSDGIADRVDNCVRVSNPDQTDLDKNQRGDVCDDFDKDGILNHLDNCPEQPNKLQRDEDADGIGDACDGDENRLTEKYPWLVWLAMVFSLLVIATMFVSTIRKK